MRVPLRIRFFRRAVVSVTIFAFVCQSLGCGTLLHPERRGQPPGRIDPAIAVLNGVGLLLFVVPGLIAFAVDFATGAIYLPPDYYGQAENGSFDASTCDVIHVPPSELTQEQLETVLSERTGHSVKLAPGSYNVRPLSDKETEDIKILGQSE
jgi:hypothetical protein